MFGQKRLFKKPTLVWRKKNHGKHKYFVTFSKNRTKDVQNEQSLPKLLTSRHSIKYSG